MYRQDADQATNADYKTHYQNDVSNFLQNVVLANYLSSCISASNVVDGINNKQITLKMRTFESTLFHVAKQEVYFNEMTNQQNAHANFQYYTNIEYTANKYGPVATIIRTNIIGYETIVNTNYGHIPEFSANYPTNQINATNVYTILIKSFKVSPLMMLSYDRCRPPTTIVTSIDYHGKTYIVGDNQPYDGLVRNPNHVVFTMLSYLFAQSAISTQNLPVQQLIQVQ